MNYSWYTVDVIARNFVLYVIIKPPPYNTSFKILQFINDNTYLHAYIYNYNNI